MSWCTMNARDVTTISLSGVAPSMLDVYCWVHYFDSPCLPS